MNTVKLLMADGSDSKGGTEFEAFVQNEVKQQGFILTEDEEKMVQDAIARTLADKKDSGVDLDDSGIEDVEEVNEVFAQMEIWEIFLIRVVSLIIADE